MNAAPQKIPALMAFLDWRQALAQMEERVRRFDAWVFLNASSVLLSEKTGELLAMDLQEMGMTADDVEFELERLSGKWNFDYKLFAESNGFLKFIVYRRDRLRAVLDESPYCVMVGQLNYSHPLSPESFLGEVKERWLEQGSVPHEIGVALGYPLEDVFGYMGLMPLACKGVCGWRVYGCMKESQRRSCAFNNARCQALAFLAGSAAA
ncbi:DUF3793 family protein [Pelagicoccus albus]|uniref:DUF3793 family protein n=1 Tax=Pelagicoccus albus TaxID=415222 RepID=A0A7X1BBC9_9BACT|nr:DUF3793 family protein [Pelagicoccus albus]MBC2607845.1 DUF3793 family protein [Pelagicoccus albus]